MISNTIQRLFSELFKLWITNIIKYKNYHISVYSTETSNLKHDQRESDVTVFSDSDS